jgi:outer membrane protein assembly factor BamD
MADRRAVDRRVTRVSRWTWGAVATLATLAGAACGGNPPPEVPLTTEGADLVLYERGQEALAEERWSLAREYFLQIRDNYPQSPMRADARVGLIETYEGENSVASMVTALTELREFLRLYPPTHPVAPVAQFKLAMVYFNQMRRPERDQSETRLAIEEFGRFLEQYAEYATPELIAEVRTRLRDARDRLNDSSYLVGRFYWRLRYYAGAIDRFREILDADPDYTRRDQVYYHLADSLAELGRGAEALPLLERLVVEFPETDYLEDATERIAALKVRMDLDQ